MSNPSNFVQRMFVGDGSVAGPSFSFLDDTQTGFFLKSAGVIGLAISGSEIVNWSSSGQSEVGGIFSAADGSAAAPSFSFTSDSDNGMYLIAANNPGFSAGGSQIFNISSAGLNLVSTFPLNIAKTSNQMVLGTTNTTTISASAPAASVIYTMPDQGGAANFVMSAGTAQTVSSALTFSSALSLTAASNQFVINPGAHKFTFTAAAPAADRVLTIPDPGGAANLVLSAGAQTISGALTLSAAPTLTAASNQLIIQPSGSGNTVTVTAANPATSAVLTIPDPGAASANVLLSQGAQTVAGAQTFSSAVTVTPTTNQLVLGTTRTVTISAAQPATSSRVYTIPDQGAAANFLMSAAAQTIAGIQTFSALPVFSVGISTPRANVSSTATINSLASTNSFVKLTGSTATTINGIAAGVDGQRIVIANLTGQNMTISNASASAASGAKITTMTGSDVVTTGNGCVELIYDTDASPAVWLLISQNL